MSGPFPGPGGGHVSDNAFHGSANVQAGGANFQNINHYPPPSRSVWPAVGGVLSVVLAAAAGALLVALKFGDDPDDRGGGQAREPAPASVPALAPGTSGPAAAPRTTPPSTPPAPRTGTEDAADRVQWTGTLRITEEGPRLDERPPVKYSYLRDVWLAQTDPAVLQGSDWSVNSTNLALWQGSTAPTRKDCAELVSTQGIDQVEVGRGTVVCVRTMYGRTAVLTVVSVSSSLRQGVLAEARVWSETETPETF
ncbi:hypothetical protein ACFPM3_11355 [Streptomyces coeruleoprunus]|uniref:Serine/threonine protein kinase n=1 Tax=Streptomyces coeruleoprunus TaxID=285563 RepID=A0ABV9XDI5_9ACTN